MNMIKYIIDFQNMKKIYKNQKKKIFKYIIIIQQQKMRKFKNQNHY